MLFVTNVNDYCKSSQDFQQLLEKFSKGYIPIYNKRRIALRNEIKPFMKLNFYTWYYSADSPMYCVSPARLINSHIYYKLDPGSAVFPVCQPVYKKDKLMDITYSFRVYTLDDHPFIRDMQLFLETVQDIPNKIQKDDAIDSVITYANEYFPALVKHADFTFNELPYVVTLGDACERLSLAAFSGDSGKSGLLLNEENIRAFFALPGRDKLERVITVMIERFVKCFDNMPELGRRPNAGEVEAALQAAQDLDGLMDELFGDLFDHLHSFFDAAQDIDVFMASLDEKKATKIVEAQAVSTACNFFYFTTFGRYLQLIQPEYDDEFIFMQADDEFLEMLKLEEENADDPLFKSQIASLLYQEQPGGYSITALGAGRCNMDLSRMDLKWYPLIPPKDYSDTLADMLEDGFDEEIYDRMGDILGGSQKMDDVISSLADMIQREMPSYKEPDPLEGLNPDGLPVFTDENAVYIFKTKRQTIELKGTETLADLSYAVQAIFDLNEERMSSFYMGTKFFEAKREIQCPLFWLFANGETSAAEKYKIHELNLYAKQKFLYLHDFMRENRFTITFAGIKKE